MTQFARNGLRLSLFFSVPDQIINYRIILEMVDADPHACTMTHMGHPAHPPSCDTHTSVGWHFVSGTHTVGPSRHQHPNPELG